MVTFAKAGALGLIVTAALGAGCITNPASGTLLCDPKGNQCPSAMTCVNGSCWNNSDLTGSTGGGGSRSSTGGSSSGGTSSGGSSSGGTSSAETQHYCPDASMCTATADCLAGVGCCSGVGCCGAVIGCTCGVDLPVSNCCLPPGNPGGGRCLSDADCCYAGAGFGCDAGTCACLPTGTKCEKSDPFACCSPAFCDAGALGTRGICQ
jgi:hypothetical protein